MRWGMDCHRCLEEKAESVKMVYRNENIDTIFLCENCINFVGDDESIKEIELSQIM